MLANKTLTEMIETAPTPILLWNRQGQRLWLVLWQYFLMLSLITAGAGFATFFAFGDGQLPITLWIFSGFWLVTSTIGFITSYYDPLSHRRVDGRIAKQRITRKIHKAAQLSLEKPVNLSEYVNLDLDTYYFGANERYLQSLSPRHIKWAKKRYAKSIEEIRHNNFGKKRNLRDSISSLDEASNEKLDREFEKL